MCHGQGLTFKICLFLTIQCEFCWFPGSNFLWNALEPVAIWLPDLLALGWEQLALASSPFLGLGLARMGSECMKVITIQVTCSPFYQINQ